MFYSKFDTSFYFSKKFEIKGGVKLASYRDLQAEVNRLNNKYCKRTKNELTISRAYGGYSVELVGKRNKRTGKRLKGAMTGASSVGNQYHDTATNTLIALYKADARGWVKNSVKSYEPEKVKKKKYF